ncbi:hypothetical protein [Sneathiella sp. HT1-7]|uniref:hypothetical protein n=1 Tax=Sneathiella sp. HT1-7 TaxID=2887192 RepID=UPI001D14A4DC|nr:hypothetical protein [Sneathiella sp. HT1-7]MCC3304909.1 hypothetical protein [Sneathiella sp. HT1-7]
MAPLNKKHQPSLFIAASLTAAIAALPALAAPQILAVAATDLKLPVTCEAGECTVELTTICLQEHRASPNIGAGYYVHGETFFDLMGRNAAGQEISLAHLPLEITAARGHNAVRLAFQESQLTKYGPLEVSISVPKNLSLVPLPIANDVKPQTEEDILLATGPLRAAATQLVDLDENKRDAAELINQAINRLPWRGRASDEDRATVRASYQEITKSSGFASGAKDNANAVVKECYDRTIAGSLSFRGCLGSWHDRMIGKLNTKYWKSLGAGS